MVAYSRAYASKLSSHLVAGLPRRRSSAALFSHGSLLLDHLASQKKLKQNLKIIAIDNDNNLLIVKGSVPGKKNSIIYLKDSVKRS